MSTALCPDVQSPELSVPCPTDPGPLFSPPDLLPHTGTDLIFLLFHLALLAVLIGVAVMVWKRT